MYCSFNRQWMGVSLPLRRRTSPFCLKTTPPTRLNRYSPVLHRKYTFMHCLFLDHWKHWHGVQWDGSWLQASHPQSKKDGTGSVKKIVFGLLSSLLPFKDYYLMYHETIPTAQLVYRVALVMQEYTQSGGVSKIMFMSWHCYVIKSCHLHGWCQAPNQGCRIVESTWQPKFCAWQSA